MNFYLPDFHFKQLLNLKLIDLIHNNPEYFYDDIQIGVCYGSFPGAIWNGGRQMNGIVNQDYIQKTINVFNSKGVAIHFTFTNCLLEEKHVYDTYCNMIMDCANNGMNGVIINSPILEEYLREKYPNFKYISSTTLVERDINKINAACNKYNMVVPDYRDSVDIDFLKNLSQKDKIEILINAYCDPNCQFRRTHYEALSLGQLTYSHIPNFTNSCETQGRSFLDTLNFPTVIKVEDLYSTYKDLGFTNFKIEGRLVHVVNVVESYVYYLVKPEYKDKVRLELLIKGCKWN